MGADITVTFDLRSKPGKVLIEDNFNYEAAGWNLSDASVVVSVTGPLGVVYSNTDYDSPDIEPATSRLLNKTINLPMDPAVSYQNILQGNFTIKVSRYNAVLDETEETLETYAYGFSPPTLSNTTTSGPYSGILKSIDDTEYGNYLYSLTRSHRVKYPTQLDPVPADVVSSGDTITITPIYTNEWTIQISVSAEYRYTDLLRVLWQESGEWNHCVYGACISAMYLAIDTMLQNYFDPASVGVRNQEAYQKRLVAVNTAWHLLNIAYQSNNTEEADRQSAIIHEQINYTGAGRCGGTTSIEVSPCPVFNGGGGTLIEYTAENGLSKISNAFRLGGILDDDTIVDAGEESFELKGESSSLATYSLKASASPLMELYLSAVDGDIETKVAVGEGPVLFLQAINHDTSRTIKYLLSIEEGLREESDYSADYTDRSLISKGYFLANNNWGSQAVEVGASLTGDGTSGSPLAVANPFPGFSTLLEDYGYEPPAVEGSFTDLDDTPSAYAGHGGKYVRVKSDATGLEFVAVSPGGGTPDHNDTTNKQGGTSGEYYHLTQTDYAKRSSWDAAYGHISTTNNPHSVTKTQVGLGNVANESKATMFTNPVFTGTVKADSIESNTVAFVAGFAGEGYKLYKNASNLYELTLDGLTVRGSMSVYELIINRIRATNGSLWVTDSARISGVADLGGGDYGCDIDDSDGDIAAPFEVGDILRCQVWTGSGIKYYSAEVEDVSAGYFEMAIIDGTDIPEVGDTLVRVGNSSDSSRRGSIYLTSSDTNAPYLDVMDGVVDESFSGKVKVRLGKLDGITDTLLGSLTGYGLYSSNAFLSGKVVLPSAGMTNDGSSSSDVRIWAGDTYANRGTAPFRITQDGSLTAQGVAEIGTAAVLVGSYTQALAIKGGDIWENSRNDDYGTVYINRRGYTGGSTRFRDTIIGDGKTNELFGTYGSLGVASVAGVLGMERLRVTGDLTMTSLTRTLITFDGSADSTLTLPAQSAVEGQMPNGTSYLMLVIINDCSYTLNVAVGSGMSFYKGGRILTAFSVTKQRSVIMVLAPLQGGWIVFDTGGEGYAPLSAVLLSKSSTYELAENDNNKIVECNGTFTLTLPNSLSTGFQATIVNIGTGTITIAASGTLYSKDSKTKIVSQYGGATVYHRGFNVWLAMGDLST